MSSIKRNGILAFCALFAASVLCGCALSRWVKKKKKEKLERPRIVVLNFSCESSKVGDEITKGLVENVAGKVIVLDQEEFQVLLSSITRQKDAMREADAEMKKFRDDVPEDLAELILGKSAAGSVYEPIVFSSATFFRDLVRDNEFRSKVLNDARVHYVVSGSARYKRLGTLETGNLETAETASMKVLDLNRGFIMMDENFKQGFFEIIAPGRIGKKFAFRVNRELKQMRKEDKRRKKERRKRAEYSYPY